MSRLTKLASTHEASRLLRLPAETRFLIWSYAVPQGPDVNICPCLDHPDIACEHYKKRVACAIWQESVGDVFSCLPLVSRQVQSETRGLFEGIKNRSLGFCTPMCFVRFLGYLTLPRRKNLCSKNVRFVIRVPYDKDQLANPGYQRRHYLSESAEVVRFLEAARKEWYFGGFANVTHTEGNTGRLNAVLNFKYPIRTGVAEDGDSAATWIDSNSPLDNYWAQEERVDRIKRERELKGLVPD